MSTCQPLPPKFKSDKGPFSALKWWFENGKWWSVIHGKGLSNGAQTGGRQGENELLTGGEIEEWKLRSEFQSSARWRKVWQWKCFGLIRNFNRTTPHLFLVLQFCMENLAALEIQEIGKWDYVCLLTDILWVKKKRFPPKWNETAVDSGWDHISTDPSRFLAVEARASQMISTK